MKFLLILWHQHRVRATTRRITLLFDRYDHGGAMIDHLTSGALTYLRSVRDHHLDRLIALGAQPRRTAP